MSSIPNTRTSGIFPDWVKTLERLGSFGLLAVMVWWIFTRLIPDAQATYERSLRDQQQAFKETLTEQRKDFLDALREIKSGK